MFACILLVRHCRSFRNQYQNILLQKAMNNKISKAAGLLRRDSVLLALDLENSNANSPDVSAPSGVSAQSWALLHSIAQSISRASNMAELLEGLTQTKDFSLGLRFPMEQKINQSELYRLKVAKKNLSNLLC